VARRTQSRRRPDSPRIDLPGPQRKAYLVRAAFCEVAALAPALLRLSTGISRTSDRAFLVGWAVLMTFIAAYHVRAAYGWVHIEPAGLRTSRLWRARYLRWNEIAGLEPKTWRGKGGHVTVVRVRTRSGHPITSAALPADFPMLATGAYRSRLSGQPCAPPARSKRSTGPPPHRPVRRYGPERVASPAVAMASRTPTAVLPNAPESGGLLSAVRPRRCVRRTSGAGCRGRPSARIRAGRSRRPDVGGPPASRARPTGTVPERPTSKPGSHRGRRGSNRSSRPGDGAGRPLSTAAARRSRPAAAARAGSPIPPRRAGGSSGRADTRPLPSHARSGLAAPLLTLSRTEARAPSGTQSRRVKRSRGRSTNSPSISAHNATASSSAYCDTNFPRAPLRSSQCAILRGPPPTCACGNLARSGSGGREKDWRA
jgi:hypothetical protein